MYSYNIEIMFFFVFSDFFSKNKKNRIHWNGIFHSDSTQNNNTWQKKNLKKKKN